MASRVDSLIVFLAIVFQQSGFLSTPIIQVHTPSSEAWPLTTLSSSGDAPSNKITTWTVNNANDTNDGSCNSTHCSLRESVASAQIDDTITFTYAISQQTILLTSPIELNLSITIDGRTQDGSGQAGGRIHISGNDLVRVFNVGGESSPTLQHLKITNGEGQTQGGAIQIDTANLTLIDCLVANNHASSFGSGGGGIYQGAGTLRVYSSTISNNGADMGGGIFSRGFVEIYTSTIDYNQAPSMGGGIFIQDFYYPVELSVFDSTIHGNTSFTGGGVYSSALAHITNTTVSGNVGGGIRNDNEMYLTNVTIVNNLGDGVESLGTGIENNSTISYSSVLIAGNPDGDCTGAGYSINSDYSFGGDGSCGFFLSGDPLIGPLADNGGPTLTHALLPGSPTIDFGSSATCPSADQRGVPRPLDGNGDGFAGCDIGAYEVPGEADFGDAPLPYPTLNADYGAIHFIRPGFYLGSSIDGELDGIPSAIADGDDLDNLDDEDGAVFTSPLRTNSAAQVEVVLSGEGYLHAWIDFNQDGDWADPGEKIILGSYLAAGSHLINFRIPVGATVGTTQARLRLSSASNLSYSGMAVDGEVEDYLVTIDPGPPLAVPDSAALDENSNILVDVLANDSDPYSSFQLFSVGLPARGTAVLQDAKILYTPNPDFNGTDSFPYTLKNGLGFSSTAQVTLFVRNINSVPSNILLGDLQPLVAGCSAAGLCTLPAGTLVGTLLAVDPDPGDTHIFNLIASPEFRLTGNRLYTQSPITFTGTTNSTSRSIQVSATDASGLQFNKTFTVYILGSAVGGGPEKVLLSPYQVAENLPTFSTVGVLSTQEAAPHSPYLYTLVAGEGSTDNPKFRINAGRLETAQVMDFETRDIYRVRIRTQNNLGQARDEILTIQLLDDPNEIPLPPPFCSTSAIELINSGNVELKILNAVPSNVTLQGCDLAGDLSIKFSGWAGSGYLFLGRVNQHNQITAPGGGIGTFNTQVAGVPLQVTNASLEYYDGRYGLRFGGASFCLPEEWGGLCAPSSLGGISILLTDGGLKAGAGEISFPDIKIAGALSLSGLKGSFLPVLGGGYEISLSGEFGLPKFKAGSKGGCGISASVTLYANKTGGIVMEVHPRSSNPKSVSLREITVGISCGTGIPIDATGIALTGVEGTVSLYPDSQFVSLTLTVQTVKKIPVLNISPIKGTGTATVYWKPDWMVRLSSALYLLDIFQISQTEVTIRENQVSFLASINTWLISTTLEINAWTNASGFHLTGQGMAEIGFKRGKIIHECVTVWYPTKVCWKWGIIPYPCRWRSNEVCLDIPPFDLTATIGVDFGEFTNGAWGFKGYVSLFGINVGIYIDSSPILHIGGVSQYQLITPPKIQQALVQWRFLRAMGIEAPDLSAVNPDILVTNPHTVAVRVPVRVIRPDEQVEGQQTTPYELENQKDTLFTLATSQPLRMTLQAPDGTLITPENYTLPPVVPTYVVEYSEEFYYQADTPDDTNTADQPKLRFILAATSANWDVVDVSLDGVLLYDNLSLDASAPANYLPVYAGTHTLAVTPSLGGEPVSINFDTESQQRYTILASGASAIPALHLLVDDHSAPSADGLARLRFVHSALYSSPVDVYIGGVQVLDDAVYLDVSPYIEFPVGENLVEIKDSGTAEAIAPPIPVDLSSGGVYTLFTAAYPAGEYPITWGQYQDFGYLKRYYTQYKVNQASIGEWLVILDGDLENTLPILGAIGLANPPTWGNVIGQISNPLHPEITWELNSDYLPTTITIYADPMPEIKSVPPIFDGFQVAEVPLTLEEEVSGEPYTYTVDLSALESATYTLWVRVQDGINPPISTYVLAAGGAVAEFEVDQSASFPSVWNPTNTIQVSESKARLFLEWSGLDHPDVDSYTLYFNTLPFTPVTYTARLSAFRETDQSGKAVGDLLVNTSVSNLVPGQTYYYSFEAVDEDGEKSVFSPEYTLTIPGGDFQLVSLADQYLVAPGRQTRFLLSMLELQPLFYPNVGLSIDTSQLPPGMRVWFNDPSGGDAYLNPSSAPVMVQVDVASSVPLGIYSVTITGDNGIMKRHLEINLHVSNLIYLPVIRR